MGLYTPFGYTAAEKIVNMQTTNCYRAHATGSVKILVHLKGSFSLFQIWSVPLQSIQDHYICSFTVQFYSTIRLPNWETT